jgi:hypothetical protein
LRPAFATLAPILAALALSACAYNPELGRQQMTIVNDASLAQAGEQAWSQALATSKVSANRAAKSRPTGASERSAHGIRSSAPRLEGLQRSCAYHPRWAI